MSTERETPRPPGHLSQCSATLSMKFFLVLRWNSLCCSLCAELGNFHFHAEAYVSHSVLSRGYEQVHSKRGCVCVHENFNRSNSVLSRMFSQCVSTVVFLVWKVQKSTTVKIHVCRNQKFMVFQVCSKQNQTTKAKPTETQKQRKRKSPKPSHGFYKNQKLLILAVQTEMSSKHRSSRRTIAGILSEEKGAQPLKVLEKFKIL